MADAINQKGGSAEPVVVDTTREDDVVRLFDRAMAPGDGRDPADLVVFNAGNNQRIDFLDLRADQFEQFWRVGCFGGFLVGREAARRLVPLGRGTIIFTGASGSLRGKPGFAHFAAAKAGLRMISQSMAREYGPLGIHVAHVVIDGGINGDRLLSRCRLWCRSAARMACLALMRSRTRTGRSIASSDQHGRKRSMCGRTGSRSEVSILGAGRVRGS